MSSSVCKSVKHKNNGSSRSATMRVFVKNDTSSQVSKTEMDNLIRNGFVLAEEVRRLNKGRNFLLCLQCIKDGGKIMDDRECNSTLEELLVVCKKLEGKSIGDHENIMKLGIIINNLASTQQKNLYQEGEDLRMTKKNNQFLKDFGLPELFLHSPNRNHVLMEALKGFSGFNPLKDENQDKAATFCLSYENVLKTRHSMATTPVSLNRNFRLLERTNKPSLVNNCGHPAGGKYLVAHTLLHEKLPTGEMPPGDFTSHLDNMQITDIRPNSRIEVNQRFNVHVKCSNTLFVGENYHESHILENEENKPSNWTVEPNSDIIEEMLSTYENHAVAAEESRHNLMEQIIIKVEQEINDGEAAQSKKGFRLLESNSKTSFFPCKNCPQIINMENSTQCSCGYSPLKGEPGSHAYGFVPSGDQNNVELQFEAIGDFNPSGYSGLRKLVNHTRINNIERANKKLAVATVDCRIFVDATKFSEANYCEECKVDFMCAQSEDHLNHKTVPNSTEEVVFVLGWGHLKLLLDTTYIQTSWDVYMANFAKNKLGFRTKKALNTFFRGRNHRKAHQAVRTTTEAAMHELVTLYVQETSPPYNPNRFNLWARGRLQSPQAYWFYTFHYSFGMFLITFHAAMRRSNVAVAKGCIFKLLPLLNATKHPLYRAAVLQDLLNDTMMPKELREFVDAHRCVKRCRVETDRNTGKSRMVPQTKDFVSQAADMIGEEAIRIQTSCVNRRAAAGREFEEFQLAQLRCNFYGEGIMLGGTGSLLRRPISLDREIVYARHEFRNSEFLDSYGNGKKPFLSFDGKIELDEDFHNIKFRGDNNFHTNLSELSAGKTYSQLDKEVIPITKKDREKMNALTSKTIKKLHEDLTTLVNRHLGDFPSDRILLDTKQELSSKQPASFSKVKLINMSNLTNRYLKDKKIEQDIFNGAENEESDSEDDLI